MAARSSNRFRALENVNGSAKEESESSANIHTTIEDAVKTAMEEAVASTNGSRTKKAGQKVNVSKSDLAMIGEIVAQVMLGVQPLITSVVTSAVTASTRAILADVAESHTQLRNEVASLQKEVRLHRFLRKPVGAMGDNIFHTLWFYFIWRPPNNYMASAKYLYGGRHIIIWRPPYNYMTSAKYLYGGRQIIIWRPPYNYMASAK